MPGYCVAGTVGYRILNNAKRIEFENKQFVDVKLQVQYMSFSAHADAKGVCVCKIGFGSPEQTVQLIARSSHLLALH